MKNASQVAFFISTLILGYYSFFFYPRWDKPGMQAAISYDVAGYYWYLPSIFIYNDLKKQEFASDIQSKYDLVGNQQPVPGYKLENGNFILKYSAGMSVMYSPFFFIAHLYAALTEIPADGFSAPYQFCLQLGGFIISIIGLWYLRKLLLTFYGDLPVAITLLALVAGTNYLNYSAIDSGMPHTWLFTLYTLLILNTISFYKEFKTKYCVRIGLLAGLIVLTRPTDIIGILIPLLWGLETVTISSIKQRFSLLFQLRNKLIIAALATTCVFCVQVIYWEFASGDLIIYSYQDQEFSWAHPHFLDYMFSYRSGWITYSPIMIFAFIGIPVFLLYGRNKVAIITFFFISLYVTCAWDIWWYGWTGGRAMIQSYPVLLFPIASFISYVIRHKILKVIAIPVLIFCVYLNLWFTHQVHTSNPAFILTPDIQGGYFWKTYGRL